MAISSLLQRRILLAGDFNGYEVRIPRTRVGSINYLFGVGW
jgi:hypothetical protein